MRTKYLKWAYLAAILAVISPMKKLMAEEFIIPTGQDGHAVPVSDYAGWLTNCYIDAAQGTTAIECSSNTASVGNGSVIINTTGPGEVLGVIVSSQITSGYIVLRDSATANVNSATMTIVYASGSNTNPYIKFPVPLRYYTGLSVNASAAPTAPNSWLILYRPYKESY